MRTTTTPALLALLLLAAPAAGVPVDYPAPTGETAVGVDLVADAGTTVDVHVDVAAEKDGGCLSGLSQESDARTATLALERQGGGNISLALDRVASYNETNDLHIVFTASLPVDHADLTAGTWSMELTVSDGLTQYDCGDARGLVVEADGDTTSPVVSFPTARNGTIRLGPRQAIVANVTDDTLGRVEYRVDRMPQFFLLDAPYIIPSESFFPGKNNLTVRATDRAGNNPTQANVTVLVDGDDPELDVDLLNRTTFYQGVDNPIVVRINDTNDYRLTVAFQGSSIVLAGSGGQQTNFTVGIPGNRTGEDLLRVRVVDAFGNTAAFTQTLTVEQLSTDARIVEVKQVGGPYIVGENVTVRVVMEQQKTVANVTFLLRLDGSELGGLEVPARGANETNLTTRLPPGRQTLQVQAVQPDGVLADADALTAKVPVEVFLARVIIGGDAYHVRSTSQGLPDGVVTPNGTLLATALVDQGDSSVYAFQVDGVQYFWDPEGPLEQEFTEAEPPGDGGNESPGVTPLLLVLSLLGLAVALRRRA